ncbi:hypothetical protein [Salidesulfovibrio onnuriiensis]|uniref:hypothetical protein n=1 Tax=Salidesulfovibrio onnuriiensis TaxID=2583823 RepID=UPI0011CB7889|nr:hypothetical protein [Salidesulfovibrio onnuriiensis]
MKRIASDNETGSLVPADLFTLSPITSAGIQARNFTAGFVAGGECIAPDFYTPTSLDDDIADLCDPSVPVSDERLFNVVVKYFCAYVDDSAFCRAVPFAELARLYEKFGRHQSLNEPEDDIEIMNRMRQLSGALRVLADAPRMAHVMRDIIAMDMGDNLKGGYVGIDVGAATGILLVALHIHARRNGAEPVLIRGYSDDPVAGERTHDLVRCLGAGDILRMDPSRARAFRWLNGLGRVVVVNEMLSGMQRMLKPWNFFDRYKALVSAAPQEAQTARFYPEGIIAYSREANMSLILSPESGYGAPEEYAGGGFTPQGFVVRGQVTPTHKLGADFYRYLLPERS